MKIDKTCEKCFYYTDNPKHTHYKCHVDDGTCPAFKQREKKEQLYRFVELTPEEALARYKQEFNLGEYDIWIGNIYQDEVELATDSVLHDLVVLKLSYFEPI